VERLHTQHFATLTQLASAFVKRPTGVTKVQGVAPDLVRQKGQALATVLGR